MAKRKIVDAKPKRRKMNSTRKYPYVEVVDGRIYLQAVKGGKYIKMPVGRAEYIGDRLIRAAANVRKLKGS